MRVVNALIGLVSCVTIVFGQTLLLHLLQPPFWRTLLWAIGAGVCGYWCVYQGFRTREKQPK